MSQTRLGVKDISARLAVLACAAFMTACAQTMAGPGLMLTSDYASADIPATSMAPPPAPVAAGYLLTGPTFAGDLRFVEAGGVPRAVYAHAVDGAPTLHAELQPDRNWLSDGVRRFLGQSDQGVPITLELQAGPCRLGDRLFGRFAFIAAGRLSYEGCAEETGPVLSWSEDLPDYLPMIQACLDATQTSSMAFVRGAGRVQVLHVDDRSDPNVVRMRFGDSGRWDCTLDHMRATWRVVRDNAPERPGEADPVFFPGIAPESGDACYLYEHVVDESGHTLGALGYDACDGGSVATLRSEATNVD